MITKSVVCVLCPNACRNKNVKSMQNITMQLILEGSTVNIAISVDEVACKFSLPLVHACQVIVLLEYICMTVLLRELTLECVLMIKTMLNSHQFQILDFWEISEHEQPVEDKPYHKPHNNGDTKTSYPQEN